MEFVIWAARSFLCDTCSVLRGARSQALNRLFGVRTVESKGQSSPTWPSGCRFCMPTMSDSSGSENDLPHVSLPGTEFESGSYIQ